MRLLTFCRNWRMAKLSPKTSTFQGLFWLLSQNLNLKLLALVSSLNKFYYHPDDRNMKEKLFMQKSKVIQLA